MDATGGGYSDYYGYSFGDAGGGDTAGGDPAGGDALGR